MNAILGYGKALSTIRIVGWAKKQRLLILIDNWFTHSFVDPFVAKIM